MGHEATSSETRIQQFFGIHNKTSDLSIDPRECSEMKNYNITETSLIQRGGQSVLSSNKFLDRTDSFDVNLTGIYEAEINSVKYKIGVGGNSFRSLGVGSTWGSDLTNSGAVAITNNDYYRWSFIEFINNAGNECVFAANGIDAPFYWEGSGNASTLASSPGNFKYPVVNKNKMWVAVGDIVYFSELRNGESWNTTDDLVRFQHKGEVITGLYIYQDRVIVFQPSQISVISGSDNRDLFVQTIVTDGGCLAGETIREVKSSRYGNILLFLGNDGTIQGFNMTKNLIKLGDPAEPLFNQMNFNRLGQAVGEFYDKLGQYWVSLPEGSSLNNDAIIYYDFRRDNFSSAITSAAVSTIGYLKGIEANCLAKFIDGSGEEILVSGNYDADLVLQNTGANDFDEAIETFWVSGKYDCGSPSYIKLLTDINMILTIGQSTNMTLTVTSDALSASGDHTFSPYAYLWSDDITLPGSLIWGAGLWTEKSTRYGRMTISFPEDSGEEGGLKGRWFKFRIGHNEVDVPCTIEEFQFAATNLGMQPEYTEED